MKNTTLTNKTRKVIRKVKYDRKYVEFFLLKFFTTSHVFMEEP